MLGPKKGLKNFKKFTYKEIQDKVAERWQIHNYYEVLMECAVHEEDSGVYFNLQHPSWKRLLDLVQKHEGGKVNAAKHRKRRDSGTQQISDTEFSQTEAGAVERDRESSKDSSVVPVLDTLDIESTQNSPARRSKTASEPTLHNDSESPSVSRTKIWTTTKEKHRPRKRKSKTRQEWTELLTKTVKERAPESPSRQIKVVRQCCHAVGVPPNLRAEIWRVMLGLNLKARAHEPLPEQIISPLFNQKTINLDCERTRPTIPPFKDPDVRKSMEIILTEYCRRRHISYVQGMNYVLCPFYLLKLADIDEIYCYFDAFVRMFLPNTFTDSEFGALQCIFRLFKLLLQYHDPELSLFLDQYDTPPEVYASQWFVTLYAQKCAIDTLLQIWDDLLLNPNPKFHYFLSLELLRSQKEKILGCRVDELPEVMASISIPDKYQSRILFLEAKKTASATPNSFHDLLHKCITQKVVVDGALYTELLDLKAMAIEPKELVEQLYNDSAENKEDHRASRRRRSPKRSQIKFFVIDCRPLEQYEAGHLPLSFHLDPSLNSESLQEKMKHILRMKGSAFCLFFDGVPSKRTNMNYSSHLYYFLNKRIKYVSICRGGYYRVHQMLVSGEIVLVDHDSARCLECSGYKKNQNKGNFASYMKKFYNAAESLKRSNQNRVESSIPKAVRVLPPTVDLRLTMTVLRDKNTSNKLYHKATNRLLSVLVAETIEKNNISQLRVETNSSFPYNGFQTVKSIYGVALDEQSQHCLEEALEVYKPVARTVVGQLRIEEKFTQDKNGGMHNVRSAVAYTPKDIEDRRVIVFNPVLGSKNDIHSAIEALYQMGTKDLTILAIVASRPILWVLLDQFPSLQIICAAVDGFTKGHVDPGIGVFSQRYTFSKTSENPLERMTTVLGNVKPILYQKDDSLNNSDVNVEEEKLGTTIELSGYSSQRGESDTSVSIKLISKQDADLGELLKSAGESTIIKEVH